MKELRDRIFNWDGWMHLALILFYTYAVMRMNQRISAGDYLSLLSIILLFSLPVLAFVTLRGLRNSRFSKRTKGILWVLLFVVYPLGLILSGWGPQLLNTGGIVYGSGAEWTYTYLALGFMLLELLLHMELNATIFSKGRFSFKRKGIIITLIVICVIFSAILVLISNGFQDQLPGKSAAGMVIIFASYCVQVIILIVSYYVYFFFNYQVLFKEYLLKRGFIHYLLGILLILLLVVPVHNYLISFLPAVTELGIHPLAFHPNILAEINFVPAIAVLVFSFPIILIIEWIRKSKLIAEMKSQQTITELNLLKQQIHPHFFFNTLNNLYSLSISDSSKTAENILNLSDLMRYVIYRAKEELVTLDEEINYLEGYIDLQKLRVHANSSITFEKDIRNGEVKIPPLLFIVILENAFKHGIDKAENGSELFMRIEQEKNRIRLFCRNEIAGGSGMVRRGIGLKNLQRRLNILFPNRHTLSVKKVGQEFHAHLNLTL